MTTILHNILASTTTCTTSSCAIAAKQLPLSSWKETFQTPFQQQSLTFATTFNKFPLPPSQTRLCALDHPCAALAHFGLKLDMSFTTWSFSKVPLPYSSHSVAASLNLLSRNYFKCFHNQFLVFKTMGPFVKRVWRWDPKYTIRLLSVFLCTTGAIASL